MGIVFNTFKIRQRIFRVALVAQPPHADIKDIASDVHQRDGHRLSQVDVLLYRPSPYSNLAPWEYADHCRPLVARAKRAAVHVLYADGYKHVVTDNVNPGCSAVRMRQVALASLVGSLRQAELEEYVRRSHSTFAKKAGVLYRTPSGALQRVFVRVGSAFRAQATLDAMAFWLLPHVRRASAVLTANWTIASAGLALARMMEHQGISKGGSCRIDTLPEYYDGGPESQRSGREIVRRLVGEDGRLCVIMSAISGARSVGLLREMLGGVTGAYDIVALYGFRPKVEVPVLCTLGPPEWDTSRRDGAKSGEVVIEIDPDSFFPATAREREVLVRKGHARPSRGFFTEYQGLGAFPVHRNAVDGGGRPRHHAIDVDVARLLKSRRFCGLFRDACLRVGGAPALVIVPGHAAGDRLAELAVSVWREREGVVPRVIRHADCDPEAVGTPHEVIRGLLANDVIVVLDDVSVRGDRLRGYQHNLRELGYGGRIAYVIGVARPCDDQEWSTRVTELKERGGRSDNPHQVEWAEYVILPDWDAAECSWCLEREELLGLQRSVGLGRASDWLTQRLTELQAEDGLTDGAFWCPDGATRIGRTAGSIFFELRNAQESDVVAAVGAAVQRVRIGGNEPRGQGLSGVVRERLGLEYPHLGILACHNYDKRFSDDALRAALWRVVTPQECRYWSQDGVARQEDVVRRLMMRRSRRHVCLVMELLVAVRAGKLWMPKQTALPWDSDGEVRKLFASAR